AGRRGPRSPPFSCPGGGSPISAHPPPGSIQVAGGEPRRIFENDHRERSCTMPTDFGSSTARGRGADASRVAGEAEGTMERARDLVREAGETVSNLAGRAAEGAAAATGTLRGATDALRDRVPESVAGAADRVADTLERAGTYLKQQDLADIRADV